MSTPILTVGDRFSPWNLFVGSFIPNWLLCRAEVSPGAKLTYARLAQYAGENGRAYPKLAELAASIGIPARNLDRYLAELKAHALIETVRRGMGLANDYYFLAHAWITETSPSVAHQESPSVAQPTIKRIRSRESDQERALTTVRARHGPEIDTLKRLFPDRSPEWIEERVADAMNHKARLKYTDLTRYCANWIKTDIAKEATNGAFTYSTPSPRRGGYAPVASAEGIRKWGDPNYKHPSTRDSG